MKARAIYNIGTDDFDFIIQTQNRQPRKLVLSKMDWVEQDLGTNINPVKTFIDGNEVIGTPSNREFFQAIIDMAWENGMRPLGYQDVKNETTAIRNHLEDMRTIVFELAEIPKPVIK